MENLYTSGYDLVTKLLGVLPIELHFIYGLCTILLFIIVLMLVCAPFVLLKDIIGK